MEGRGLGEKGGGGHRPTASCVPFCVPVFRNIPVFASVWKFLVTPLMKQFLNVLFRWMNLTENGVIRWVFIRLIVKSNSTFLFYFSHSFRYFRDPASSFWFEERRKYLPADDDRVLAGVEWYSVGCPH